MRMFAVRQFFFTLLLLLVGTVLASCQREAASDPMSTGSFTQVSAASPVGGTAAAKAQKIFAANAIVPGTENKQDYRIAPLDVIDVTVLGVNELNRTVQVSVNGMISLPLVKSIQAGGRTQTQLENDIAEKLAATYLQSPQVSVFVKEYNSQRITVDGAVKKPGIYPTSGQVSLLQAIALAEGLNSVADPTGILLFRVTDNKRFAARFDLKQIRSGKVNDPQLQAGDIVMVDESSAKTTLRDVKDALPLSGLFQLLLI
jgi:polysaccharide biosynthesis/export protein